MQPAVSAHRRLRDWIGLGTIVILFASGFTLIDITVTTITPLTMTAGRMILGTCVLYVWIRARGQHLPPLRDATGRLSQLWLYFFSLGLVGNVLPNTLIPWGQREIDSGLASILVGLMPLMTLGLSALFVKSEQINRHHLAGFGLGFLGIIVLTGPTALGSAGWQSLRHEMAVLGGAFCFAINAILIKRMPPVSPMAASTGFSICAALIAVPVALVFDAPWTLRPSALSLAGWVLLGLSTAVFAPIVYVKLIRSAGPTFAALSNYLVPPLTISLGFVLLQQQLDWNA
ncbi:MAG: hypothetical protein ETSY2_34085, partial [Candidatus Entotheonella gemina]